MTRKKRGRKPQSRSLSVDLQNPQNPEMAKEDEPELNPQNPKMAEEEEPEQNPQNPKIVGEELEPEEQQPSQSHSQSHSRSLDQEPDQESSQQEENQQQEQEQDQPEEIHEEPELEEEQGMAISPPRLDNPSKQDINVIDTPVARRPGKRKKPYSHRQREAVQKKLHLLRNNLVAIPFHPEKTLDFAKHEKLFRRLGLWDFTQIKFENDARSDLLSVLIANYNPQLRCSTVNDYRIKVSRADLARALSLPVKKDKAESSSEVPDSDADPFSDEELSVLDEFMSNYILLHEDTWMMPPVIVTWSRLLKEGKPQKIDWAGMIWCMVEKELSLKPEAKWVCYYASHLQQLMKHQKPDLVERVPETDNLVMEVEEEEVQEDPDGLQVPDLENQHIGLSLGQATNDSKQVGDEDVMDFQECKEEQEQWFLDGRNDDDGPCLRPCSLNDLRGSECEDVNKEDEQVFASSKFGDNVERVASADLIQGMEATNTSYGLHMGLLDPSSDELLMPRSDMHKNLQLSPGGPVFDNPSKGDIAEADELLMSRSDMHKNLQLNPGGPSVFDSACRQETGDGDDVHHFPGTSHQRKTTNDGHWDHTPSDFHMCFEHVQMWLGRARSMYEVKEEACGQAEVHIQYLSNQLQQRDSIIHSLEKSRMEEQAKWQQEIYRYEREFRAMVDLLNGYKRALRETRNAFSEYRQRNQQSDEPFYKDVPDSGGLVLSPMDFEKYRLEKEEQEKIKRRAIEERFEDAEKKWNLIFEEHLEKVGLLHKRLLKVEEAIKTLNVQKPETEKELET